MSHSSSFCCTPWFLGLPSLSCSAFSSPPLVCLILQCLQSLSVYCVSRAKHFTRRGECSKSLIVFWCICLPHVAAQNIHTSVSYTEGVFETLLLTELLPFPTPDFLSVNSALVCNNSIIQVLTQFSSISSASVLLHLEALPRRFPNVVPSRRCQVRGKLSPLTINE